MLAKKTSSKPADSKRAPKPARSAAGKVSGAFTAEERAAMKEYAEERKAAARRGPRLDKADGEKDLLAKVAQMSEPDRSMAQRLHAIIKQVAPGLSPRTWYGMPAYANANGEVVCFFQNAEKFKARYATLGFSDKAKLDDGNMWPTSFALQALTPGEEARITELVKKAVG